MQDAFSYINDREVWEASYATHLVDFAHAALDNHLLDIILSSSTARFLFIERLVEVRAQDGVGDLAWGFRCEADLDFARGTRWEDVVGRSELEQLLR